MLNQERKKLSSRAFRGFKVTDNKGKNYSEKEKLSAERMSHTISTADRSHNFSTISDCCNRNLDRKKLAMQKY